MASTPSEPTPAPRRASRWPALILVVLGVACFFSPRLMAVSESIPLIPLMFTYMLGPAVCALLILGWWLVMGPARFVVRLLGVVVAAALATGAWFAADPSILKNLATVGIPAAVGAASLALLLPARMPRTRALAAVVLGTLALAPWDLLRDSGVKGNFTFDVASRWKPKPEDVAIAYARANAAEGGDAAAELPASPSDADWPAFRGSRRDGVTAANVGDWARARPKELWRHPVGPGWSSVCVVGDRLFTQEQLDQEELVTCYRVGDGKQLWRHTEAVRYSDPMSGAGPRATPTYHGRKVYAVGARGVLLCLDAGTGKEVWRADLTAEDVGAKVPQFGMASSPLILDGKVIVHPGGKDGVRVAAFDAETGKLAWKTEGAAGGDAYSSPQLSTLAGVPQLLVYCGDGLFSYDPATGKELWHAPMPADPTAPAVTQPLVLPGDKVVLGGGRIGIPSRCVKVTKGDDGWKTEEVWKSIKFVPGFNDFVEHGGFLYGIHEGHLVCVDPETGKQRQRGEDYGTGQVLLAGDRLVVQAEDGRVALVKPSPDGLEEVATVKAMDDKTWNHPVAANGRLFVRNGSEIVCYDLGAR